MVGSNSLNTDFFFINQLYLGLIPIRLFCIFLYKSFLFQSFFKCFLKRFSKEVVYILRIYIFYCCFQDFEYISHVRNIYIRICKCTCRNKTGSLKVVTFTFIDRRLELYTIKFIIWYNIWYNMQMSCYQY